MTREQALKKAEGYKRQARTFMEHQLYVEAATANRKALQWEFYAKYLPKEDQNEDRVHS